MNKNEPRTVHAVVTLAAAKRVFALRDDGAVFVLLERGDIFQGNTISDPRWEMCPPVPGTVAAIEAEG